MLVPQFVAGEQGLFGGHESEDIRTIFKKTIGRNFPNECSGLCLHRPGHSVGKNYYFLYSPSTVVLLYFSTSFIALTRSLMSLDKTL